MNEAEQAELVQRAREIVDRFSKSPELQDQIFQELIADGVIDERGQVIMLRNGKHRES